MIFPEGTPNRLYFTREMAAKVVFVMLYVGAASGSADGSAPSMSMAWETLRRTSGRSTERLSYGDEAWKPGFKPIGKRWYADTTREPIRDETLRDGFVRMGAAAFRTAGRATTSGRPRYALRDDFAACSPRSAR